MFKWLHQTYLNRFKFERKLYSHEWSDINSLNFYELFDLLKTSLENDHVKIVKYIMSLPGLLEYCRTNSLHHILTPAIKFYDTEHEQIINDLIDAKVGITTEQTKGIMSPAQHIVYEGIALRTIDRLFANGENVHAVCSRSEYPILHFAALAENNALEVVKILMHYGANINQTDRAGCNVVHKLIHGTNYSIYTHKLINNELLEFLLSSGADPTAVDVYGCNTLHSAAKNKEITVETLDILFKHYHNLARDTGKCNETWYQEALAPIEMAVREDNAVVIQYLIDHAAPIDDAYTLAQYALDNPEITRILCVADKIQNDVHELLVDAAKSALWNSEHKTEKLLDSVKVIDILLDYCADHAPLTDEESKALVDIRNNDQLTLLHLAVLAENVEAVKLLCDMGYDANTSSRHWHILSDTIGPTGHNLSLNEILIKIQIVQILLEAGADPCEAFMGGWVYLIENLSNDIALCPHKHDDNPEAFVTLLKIAKLSIEFLENLHPSWQSTQHSLEGYFGKFAESVKKIIGSITHEAD